jgi:hypothetical protein
VRHLEYAGVRTGRADDLEAEGHSSMVEAAGDGGSAGERHGRRVGDGEPAHVGRHLLAVDLLDEQLRVRKRRHRGRRADQHVHLVEEGDEAARQPGLLHLRARDVAKGVGEPALGVVDDVAIEQVARFLQPLAVRGDEMHAAQHFEHVVHAAEVRRAVLHFLERRAEGGDPRTEHVGNVAIDRRAAEIGRHRGSDLAEVDGAKLGGDAPGVVGGERVALVDADLGAQQQMGVGNRAAHRSRDAERAQPCRAIHGRHKAGRRAEPGDAAERGGRAQAAAVIRARRQRDLSQRQRNSRAPRRAGAGPIWVERIAGRAVDAVGGVGAGTELRRIGLGQNDAAGVAYARNAVFVGRRHGVLEQQRAPGRAQALGGLQVLHADRQAGQRPWILAAADGLLDFLGAAAGGALVHRDDGVHRPVGLFDSREAAFQQLHRGKLAFADMAPRLQRRKIAGLRHASVPLDSPSHLSTCFTRISKTCRDGGPVMR